MNMYLSELAGLDLLTEFHDDVWLGMIDCVMVVSADNVTFRFKDEMEVKIH